MSVRRRAHRQARGAFHDTGKILHPEELDGPGSRTSPTAEQLLLEHGVDPRVAPLLHVARALGRAGGLAEEPLVALAHKLWKGVRNAELERRVIEGVAAKLGVGPWDVFAEPDTAFEEIAAGGAERLERSR